MVNRPSRMTLSARVARSPPKEDDKPRERLPTPVVETGGGMNRRTFKLRPGDKSQFSKAAERRMKELKEAAARPSPSRFSQRPDDRDRTERRAAAAKIDGEDAEKTKFIRPPVRRFAQMKHISSLDHVSSRTREITHAAEQQFNSFETFDLLPQTLEALQKDGLEGIEAIEPTPVQSLVIPVLVDKSPAPPLQPSPRRHRPGEPQPQTQDGASYRQNFKSYLIAAETGSGKTLAYVLPLMDTIKRREIYRNQEAEQKELATSQVLQSKKWMFDVESPEVVPRDTTIGKPYAVILVPTSELVFQVGALLKKLSYIIKLRTEMISKDFSGKVIRSRLFSGSTPDIVVGTPFMIDRITEANPSMLHRTSHIIVDEADSLFDRSFSPLTSAIISRAINLEKLVMCSATIPKSLDSYIGRKYPDCRRLVTANLHAIPRRVQMNIVEVEKDPYRGNKVLACADILNNISKDGTEPGYQKRVVVFVNERETTAEVTAFLRTKGFDAVEINRDSDSRKILESFTGDKQVSGETGRGAMKVLVTTDLASRGVDTKTVKNVVLYDVPYTSIDFIHRLGRTGRMGRRGRAWVLVDKDSNTEWVKEVRKTMFLGQSLI
ncbi:hypothetical protein ABW19_dt0208219 [Dactylella cylindrospora]|nr:hypothetical protein ABW19_dt0208219 [Dactylella cylindrospora]